MSDWKTWTCSNGHTLRRTRTQCHHCREDRPTIAPIPTSHPLPDLPGFEDALISAIDQAEQSPCSKSKRGVTIWCATTGFIYGFGFNTPPPRFGCDGSYACRHHCNKLCTHAELNAIMDCGTNGGYGNELLHVKVVDGHTATSGPPSCWQCSRQIVDAGIDGVWLLHDAGWKRYTAEEFHEATLRHCELPVIRAAKSTKERKDHV